MPLRLTLSGPGSQDTRVLTTGTLSIGRGERNDWALADPERHLSKTHCVISAEMGQYVLTDLSTNGVYINGARQRTSRDSRVILTDGDEFRLGDYTITVAEIASAAASGGISALSAPGTIGFRRDGDPLDIDPLDDPLGRSPDPAFTHPVHQTPAPRRLDDPFDREDEQRHQVAQPDDDLFAGVKPAVNWVGPSQSDHADAPRHAMAMPRVVAPVNPLDIDFDALIGDLSPFGLAATPSPAPSAPAAPPPAPPPPLLGPAQFVARPAVHDRFAEFDDLMAPSPATPQAPLPQTPLPQTMAPQPLRPQGAPQTAPLMAAAPAVTADADALQAALRIVLEGAGVAHAPLAAGSPADAEAALRNLGQVFRALTEGLREVLISRAAIKGELRVEQTMMKSTNNNPLKFSFSAEDAVVALLSAGRPGYMPPLTATREAFDDIKLHELAVIAGMQTALNGLFQRFDPAALESRLSSNILASVLPAARKARLWENFRELYKTLAAEAEDDFQAVFGKAFAKAYKAQTQRD